MNNFETKIMRVIGESTGAILFIALVTGAMWGLIKYLFIRVLKYFGIDYFAEIAESYRWIGQTLIESRAILNADRACYYRTSNGKSYIANSDFDKNKNIQVYSIVNVVRNRGIHSLPEKLNRGFFDWFLSLNSQDNYVEYFAKSLDSYSPIRNELKKYDVEGYMSIKVKFDTDLYGVILYTWSDVRSIPKNLLDKHREYLDDIKNSTLNETANIVSRSLKFRFYDFFKKRQK